MLVFVSFCVILFLVIKILRHLDRQNQNEVRENTRLDDALRRVENSRRDRLFEGHVRRNLEENSQQINRNQNFVTINLFQNDLQLGVRPQVHQTSRNLPSNLQVNFQSDGHSIEDKPPTYEDCMRNA
jgi:hypothetical protein